MTDLTEQGGGEIVEAVARAIYEAEPIEDQEVDLDGRPTGPTYTVPWDAIAECYDYVHERCLSLATAAIAAARPMILEEAAKVAEGRAAELRTAAGRNRAQWHENDAEMVAAELDRRAIAIRQLGKGG